MLVHHKSGRKIPLPEWWEMGIYYLWGGIPGLALSWMFMEQPPPAEIAPWLGLLAMSVIHLGCCRLWVWICSRFIALKWVSLALTAGQDAAWWLRLLLSQLIKLQYFAIAFIAFLCSPVAMYTAIFYQKISGATDAADPFEVYGMMASMLAITSCCYLAMLSLLMELRPSKS